MKIREYIKDKDKIGVIEYKIYATDNHTYTEGWLKNVCNPTKYEPVHNNIETYRYYLNIITIYRTLKGRL